MAISNATIKPPNRQTQACRKPNTRKAWRASAGRPRSGTKLVPCAASASITASARERIASEGGLAVIERRQACAMRAHIATTCR
ncbi:hypothetical protein ACODYM_03110 [Burkholderia gladioli]|uniref:hypothetical protein n=1 Tax=Burkholderia gladioli TaxID=28095 RepID=UPI003B50EFCE